MKLVQLLAIIGFFLIALPCLAQEDAALYVVKDVAVDISADSAAQARDEAILEAQRLAFGQVLARLGVKNAQISDDDMALMVQSFEVQKEYARGQRYIGTYTVSFKPERVRVYLKDKDFSFTEVRAQPVVILPIMRDGGVSVLWEDRSLWRNAWEDSVSKAILVPMIVPSGDLDDIAKIGVNEAMEGSAPALKSLMQKYGASGVMAVVLDADLGAGETPVRGTITVLPYDQEGNARDSLELDLLPTEGTENLDSEIRAGVSQVIDLIENDWRDAHAQEESPLVHEEPTVPEIPAVPPSGFQVFLPVDVPVPDLASWAKIKGKLDKVSLVAGTHVITMRRGLVHIELQFKGDIASLQQALMMKGVRLEQNHNGGWQILEEAKNLPQ